MAIETKSKIGCESLNLLDINLQIFGEESNEAQAGVVDREKSVVTVNESNGNDSDGMKEYFGVSVPDKTLKDSDESDESEYYDGNDYVGDDDDDGDESSKRSEVADPDEPKFQSQKENQAYQKIRQKALEDARNQAKKEIDAEKKTLEDERKRIEHYEIQKKHLGTVSDEKIYALADEKGWPLDAAREVLTNNALKAAEEEVKESYRRNEVYNLQKEVYKKKPYFDLVESKVDEFVRSNPGGDIETAYKYFVGELATSGKIDEIIKKNKVQASKETIADIQDRSRRRGVLGGDSKSGEIDITKVLSKEDIEMSIMFGNDPREIAKKVTEQIKNKKRR